MIFNGREFTAKPYFNYQPKVYDNERKIKINISNNG